MNASKYFSNTSPLHPRIAYWKSLVEASPKARVTMSILRGRDGLLRRNPRLFLCIHSTPPTLDEVSWELELDDWLIKQKIRAEVASEEPGQQEEASLHNEQERFGLHLLYDLRPVVLRYGDAFFNAVLLALVQQDFGAHPLVADVLSHVHMRARAEEGGECSGEIMARFSRLARSIESLYEGYRDVAEDVIHEVHEAPNLAEEILAGAIASYLDERFNVSERKMLGWG